MELLRFLAGEPGDKKYSTLALSHILNQIRHMDESEKLIVKPLFVQRLEDPYRRFRMLAYKGISELVATDQIEALKEISDHHSIDEEELRVILDSIRILEYNRMMEE